MMNFFLYKEHDELTCLFNMQTIGRSLGFGEPCGITVVANLHFISGQKKKKFAFYPLYTISSL